MNSDLAIARFEKAIATAVASLEADKNQIRRANSAERLTDIARGAGNQFAEQRTDALANLRDEGWSLADMKIEFGLTRQRLSQVINREDYKRQRRERGQT